MLEKQEQMIFEEIYHKEKITQNLKEDIDPEIAAISEMILKIK